MIVDWVDQKTQPKWIKKNNSLTIFIGILYEVWSDFIVFFKFSDHLRDNIVQNYNKPSS